MSDELKTCPFCGEEAEIEDTGGDSPDVYVQCTGCQAQGPATRVGCRDDDGTIDLEAEAVDLWHGRVDEQLLEKYRQLEDALIWLPEKTICFSDLDSFLEEVKEMGWSPGAGAARVEESR